MQSQREHAPTQRIPTAHTTTKPTAPSGTQVQLKSSLVGKSYDEQVALLSPEAPVQMKEGDAPAGNADGTLKEGAATQPPSTDGAAMAADADKPAAGDGSDTQRSIATTITSKRAAAAEQVKSGSFDAAFKDLREFEQKSAASYPTETKAALDGLQPTRDWLVDVIGLYLKASPIGQEVLKADKGPAKGKDDKSAEITASFISSLTSLQSAVEASFPGESARAVKEITVRRELFKLFAQHHDKSQAESGIGSAESAVKGKLEQHVTSCNAYQGQLLAQAFGNANTESSKDGGAGKIDIKATTTIGWDMKAKKTIIGPKKRNFGLYDSLGRAAKEAGAWTQGAPGLSPKAGDILVYVKGRSISHIGFFKFSEESPDGVHQIWHTFDGGQPAGTPMTAAGFTQSVRDGALNNVKRSYDKTKNTIETPSEAQLTKLRGEEGSGNEAKTVNVNQDGELRTIGGVIDVGKLIELDKEPETPDAGKAK